MSYRLLLIELFVCLPFLRISLTAYLISLLLLPLSLLLLYLQFRQDRRPASKNAVSFRNLVIAHRGGQSTTIGDPVHPENSLAAFRWAASSKCGGADAIELDVWLSKDGVMMVNHDPAVFRHFTGSGFINDMTCSELQSLKFLSEPHLPPKLTSADNSYEKQEVKNNRVVIDSKYIETERMPTLQEVITFLQKEAPKDFKLMIEVKERWNIRKMGQALKKMYQENPWMYTRCFVAGFHPFVIYYLRSIDPAIVTSFLFIDQWSMHLLKNAADMKIHVPWYLKYNYMLRWILDDTVWLLGTTKYGLEFLGANLSACEVKALSESQIRRERADGTITSTWVANYEHQKEWLLQQGVTVITDVQFGGGSSTKSPRTQVAF